MILQQFQGIEGPVTLDVIEINKDDISKKYHIKYRVLYSIEGEEKGKIVNAFFGADSFIDTLTLKRYRKQNDSESLANMYDYVLSLGIDGDYDGAALLLKRLQEGQTE